MSPSTVAVATPLKNWSREAALADAVVEAHAAYAAGNPASLRRHEAACRVMPGGNTRTVLHYEPFPLAFQKADGCHLWSVDGRRYLDILNEYTAGLYGHSHPTILRALRGALDAGISFGGHNMMEARLAELICERFPSVELIRFTNSGTEANLMAVAAATAVTGRKGVLVFHGGYHGGVFSFASGGSPTNAPYDFVVGTYNDVEGTRAVLDKAGPSLAAILVEPMLGAGGCIPATAEFLQLLRSGATRAGALLIVDEVMTSRLSPGGLAAVHGIKPDLLTLGKYLGGGMSFGAFGGETSIMKRFDPSRPDALPHAGTFNNNVLSMAAGVAGLSEIFTPAACIELNERGDKLRDDLNKLFQDRSVALQVVGYGSLMTIHATASPIRTPADLSTSDQHVKELMFFDLLEEGIWLARRGMITLSLPLGSSECDSIVDAMDRFVHRRAALLKVAT